MVPAGASFDVVVTYFATDLNLPGEKGTTTETLHVYSESDANSSNDSASATVLNAVGAPPPPNRPPVTRLPTAPPQKVEMDVVASATAASVIVGESVSVHYEIANNGNLEPAQYDFNPRVEGPAAITSATPSAGRCTSGPTGMICESAGSRRARTFRSI